MKIIIFGTGSYAESLLSRINKDDVEIIAASDNNSDKWWTSWHGIDIIPPYKLKEYEFNYILVASMYTKDIVEGLLDMGLDIREIICTYNQYEINFEHNKILRHIFNMGEKHKIALISSI
ncbi:hypothetical protein SAMN05660462_02698 [Proteiniborus ethanoligenes]|uniref:C2185-like N-terminal domain-containing protein n=1 Tax=Proteiniborus ethanoligenes TaxID=415015 RepID=A0A1H3S3X0_9FIRM|nr:hypothetical protein [Proteiniborus ethanoligenes]SDZ32716.1 hypothetical protein SAMN05660462_02698 [Proteiniborus ethanoligenes]